MLAHLTCDISVSGSKTATFPARNILGHFLGKKPPRIMALHLRLRGGKGIKILNTPKNDVATPTRHKAPS
jgi:hypothetical protein